MLAAAVAAIGASAVAQAQTPAVPATAASADGLFSARCGICHVGGGPGVMTLSKRLGKDKSLIAERTDLNPAYVKFVVRHGLRAMPPLGRAEITDAQLDGIAAYVTRHRAGAEGR
jgi:mono/diheme cytochrome c family protein